MAFFEQEIKGTYFEFKPLQDFPGWNVYYNSQIIGVLTQDGARSEQMLYFRETKLGFNIEPLRFSYPNLKDIPTEYSIKYDNPQDQHEARQNYKKAREFELIKHFETCYANLLKIQAERAKMLNIL